LPRREQLAGERELFVESRGVGRAQAIDQRLHGGVRRDQAGEYRQQRVAHVIKTLATHGEIEHAQELAARAGVRDERPAAAVRHDARPRHRVVAVAAQDRVDAGHAAREFHVRVHAVVGEQQHRIDAVGLAQARDELLQLRLAQPEGPVGHEALGMRDRNIGERLADDADAPPARLFDERRLEHPARRRLERRRVVERRVLGEKDVLRQELALEPREVPPEDFFPVGEFPVAGHGIDAEKVRGVDHIGARERLG
jgi:hypothetical protein